jgi:endoribonuclease Dicer
LLLKHLDNLIIFTLTIPHLVEQKICSIVFVQRRYAACVLSKLINNLASTTSEYQHLNSNYVTGHGSELWGVSETEMNFKKQQEILQAFRSEKFNVLVGTSVVEEGVDIPKCNLVVMFDFPQNYRAFVQSRGRGRAKDATYVMLVERSEFGERKQDQQVWFI